MNNKKCKNAARRWISAVLTGALLLGGCRSRSEEFLLAAGQAGDGESETESEEPISLTPEPASLYVDVEGAVERPGVYEMQAGARVYEAVEAAGGLLPEACAEMVNQAAVLADGQQIRIPYQEETPELTSGDPAAADGRVNLNTATEEELCTLTGIGAAKAQAILRYREEHGSFASIEELMQVEGIKEGTFNKIRKDITV